MPGMFDDSLGYMALTDLGISKLELVYGGFFFFFFLSFSFSSHRSWHVYCLVSHFTSSPINSPYILIGFGLHSVSLTVLLDREFSFLQDMHLFPPLILFASSLSYSSLLLIIRLLDSLHYHVLFYFYFFVERCLLFLVQLFLSLEDTLKDGLWC